MTELQTEMPAYVAPEPPKELHATGRKCWVELCDDMELEDLDDLRLLALACGALDRAAQANRVLRDKGMYWTDRLGNIPPASGHRHRSQVPRVGGADHRPTTALTARVPAVRAGGRTSRRAATQGGRSHTSQWRRYSKVRPMSKANRSRTALAPEAAPEDAEAVTWADVHALAPPVVVLAHDRLHLFAGDGEEGKEAPRQSGTTPRRSSNGAAAINRSACCLTRPR